MPWPQASNATQVAQTGFTTLVLGAEGYLVGNGSSAPSAGGGYIVVSAEPSQRATTIETEQGSGLTAVVTQIIDGTDFQVTVEEDATLAPPHVGSKVSVVNPFLTTTGWNVAPFGGSSFTQGVYLVLNNNVRVARKEINQRVLLLRAFSAISGINGGGNPTI